MKKCTIFISAIMIVIIFSFAVLYNQEFTLVTTAVMVDRDNGESNSYLPILILSVLIAVIALVLIKITLCKPSK